MTCCNELLNAKIDVRATPRDPALDDFGMHKAILISNTASTAITLSITNVSHL